MPIDFIYIFLVVTLFFTILSLLLRELPALTVLPAFMWMVNGLMMFYVDYNYVFYNVTSNQIVEYTQHISDGWILGLAFFGIGLIFLVFWLVTAVFK